MLNQAPLSVMTRASVDRPARVRLKHNHVWNLAYDTILYTWTRSHRWCKVHSTACEYRLLQSVSGMASV